MKTELDYNIVQWKHDRSKSATFFLYSLQMWSTFCYNQFTVPDLFYVCSVCFVNHSVSIYDLYVILN